jgi:hypothetical protein
MKPHIAYIFFHVSFSFCDVILIPRDWLTCTVVSILYNTFKFRQLSDYFSPLSRSVWYADMIRPTLHIISFKNANSYIISWKQSHANRETHIRLHFSFVFGQTTLHKCFLCMWLSLLTMRSERTESFPWHSVWTSYELTPTKHSC